MFVIRQAIPEDAPTLLKLAKMVHFINLPADPDIIAQKIARSVKSFLGEEPGEPPGPRASPDHRKSAHPRDSRAFRDFRDLRDFRGREFMFVLEDTDTGNVIGTSSIISCISWPGRPHVFMHVRKREHYSEDLQTGQVHVTMQLGTDESGPSELGGLILGPSYRGHKEKLGALLSLIRFQYLGLHREWFSDRIIAEMMGSLTPDSRNTLWEYFGRRFINLTYAEADRFCQHSKEFITSLMPASEIYVSLLPPEARNLIGKVGPETEPAQRMLERLGFRYLGHVDPFDGGPYLEANVDKIELVRQTFRGTLGEPASTAPLLGIVSHHGEAGMRAVRTSYAQEGRTVSIPAEAAALLEAEPGDDVGVTPLAAGDGARESPKRSTAERKPARRKVAR
jgi:arginine N-succinyltransferase